MRRWYLRLASTERARRVLTDRQDVEAGRTAPEALPEGRSSQMPWDIYSAIRQGSARTFRSATAGITSSVGGPGRGMEIGPPSTLSRRGSRLPTVSPLQGRGFPLPLSQRISIISTPEEGRRGTDGALGDDVDTFGDEMALVQARDESQEFELPSPATAKHQGTAGQSPWIAATLDSDSRNFLDFLDAQIQAQNSGSTTEQGEEDERPRQTAVFESLLPPNEHSQLVAAQAFLHILTLASKSLVAVRQDKGFGDIELAIAEEV